MEEGKGISLIHLHALALLEYADTRELSDVFEQIWLLVWGKDVRAEKAETPELREVLALLPPEDLEAVLVEFLKLAHERMDAVPVEVISAQTLSQEQIARLQVKLIQTVRKQVEITNSVDPTLLGGFRILVEDSVIDFSVKRKLMDARQAIYEGVYQSDGRTPQ
ncbi:MAG: ATP synthase F1 subunit delta [Clostridiales bacterium]|nr:ATP synthase F1 subunit delta [Clostridiales bacterium]